MSWTARIRYLAQAKRLASSTLVANESRSYGTDIVYWKPGPYPRTQKEREAAAHKYNLLPEDYEPYPEEDGFGDYPRLPFVHNESRPRDQDFDYAYARRNYGEPMNTEQLFTTHTHPNRNLQFQQETWKSFSILGGFVAFLFFVAWASSKTRIVFPKKPKQYPPEYFDLGSTKKHYTFEPSEA